MGGKRTGQGGGIHQLAAVGCILTTSLLEPSCTPHPLLPPCKPSQGKVEESTNTQRLENEMTSRQVRLAIDAKEKAMVDHDVTKLEVKRVRDILAMHANEVFSLENRKFQLKMSMEERRQEIEVHRYGRGWGWAGRREGEGP